MGYRVIELAWLTPIDGATMLLHVPTGTWLPNTMPENDLLQWLETRSFYALLILVLLMIGLLLALARRRNERRDRNAAARRPQRRVRPGSGRIK